MLLAAGQQGRHHPGALPAPAAQDQDLYRGVPARHQHFPRIEWRERPGTIKYCKNRQSGEECALLSGFMHLERRTWLEISAQWYTAQIVKLLLSLMSCLMLDLSDLGKRKAWDKLLYNSTISSSTFVLNCSSPHWWQVWAKGRLKAELHATGALLVWIGWQPGAPRHVGRGCR